LEKQTEKSAQKKYKKAFERKPTVTEQNPNARITLSISTVGILFHYYLNGYLSFAAICMNGEN